MNPSPPIWISTMITIFPKRLQYAPLGRTVSPVTQVALTEVNIASANGVNFPAADETGRQSRTPPRSISARKPRIMICVAENFIPFVVRSRRRIERFSFVT